MTNDIQLFHSDQFGDVRALSVDGEPWFVAKDACDALGIRTDTIRTILDEDEVSTFSQLKSNPNTIGVGPEQGGRSPLIVSEPGLYKLIMRSRKPEAKAFQRWVTHKVIPSIRRHGAYATPVTIDRIIADPQFGIRLLTELKEERDRSAALKAENHELRPKALFADAVAASDGTCLVGELAKMLRQNGVQVGQNRLFAMLREDGYLGKSGCNRNVPTQRAMEMGLFRIKETAVTHSDGHVTVNRTPKVTGKGQRYFVERYCRQP